MLPKSPFHTFLVLLQNSTQYSFQTSGCFSTKSLSKLLSAARDEWIHCHNSADSVPTSNLIYIKEVAISTTSSLIVNCPGNFATPAAKLLTFSVLFVKKIPSTNVFNVLCVKITAKKKILTGVCNPVYFQLCIDLMAYYSTTVTAEGFDGSHHLRYPEWNESCDSKLASLKKKPGEVSITIFK